MEMGRPAPVIEFRLNRERAWSLRTFPAGRQILTELLGDGSGPECMILRVQVDDSILEQFDGTMIPAAAIRLSGTARYPSRTSPLPFPQSIAVNCSSC